MLDIGTDRAGAVSIVRTLASLPSLEYLVLDVFSAIEPADLAPLKNLKTLKEMTVFATGSDREDAFQRYLQSEFKGLITAERDYPRLRMQWLELNPELSVPLN